MRKRDLLILCVACVGLFLSFQQKGGVFFQETFRKTFDSKPSTPISSSVSDNWGTHLSVSECSNNLAKPVTADLDEDGDLELVMATPDYRVVVLDINDEPNRQQFQNHGYSIKYEASVLGSIKVKKGRKPIAIQVGKLSQFNHNVVVVVTDSWIVLCYSHTLRLEWETHLLEQTPPNFPTGYLSDISIQILSFPVRVSDLGAVVIGGRSLPFHREILRHKHEQLQTDSKESSTLSAFIDDSVSDEQDILDLTHFSYYSLDGRTGAKRWKHERGDFEQIDYQTFFNFGYHEEEEEEEEEEEDKKPVTWREKEEKNRRAQINLYRDHILKESKHLGEREWTEFREHMTKHLPFRWRGPWDTKLVTDKFERERGVSRSASKSPSSSEGQTWSSEAMGVPSNYFPSFSFNKPSSEFNPTSPSLVIDQPNIKFPKIQEQPNVLVAHHSEGLEVIHLYTGFTLCRLSFESEERNVVWDDINEDLIIDQIEAFGGRENTLIRSETQKNLACMTSIKTGSSFSEEIFNGSLCFESSFIKKMKKDPEYFDQQPQATTVSVASPITVYNPSINLKSLVFLVSNGKLTSFRSSGRQQWQVQTKSAKSRSSQSLFLDAFPLMNEPDSPEYILATGEWLSLLDLEGSLLAETQISFPNSEGCNLCSSPIIVDFNGDHYNDVILMTCNAMIGLRLVEESTSILFQIFLFVLFITLLMLIIKNIREESTFSSQQTTRFSTRSSQYKQH